jgi:beta-xylosidase
MASAGLAPIVPGSTPDPTICGVGTDHDLNR